MVRFRVRVGVRVRFRVRVRVRLFKFLSTNSTITKNMRKLIIPINTVAMVDVHAQSTF